MTETNPTRQAVMYCPYCAEETLFPIDNGGWECRSCMRAFSVKFLGLVSVGQRTSVTDQLPPSREGAP